LFLCSWYPNKYEPTVGNFVKNHAKAVSRFCKVSVLYAHPNENVTGYQIETFSENNNLNEYLVYYSAKNKKDKVLRRFKAYKKGLEKIETEQGKINLTHLHVLYPAGLFAYYLKETRGIPYVITFHWSGYLPEANLFSRLSSFRKALSIFVTRKARTLLPISKKLKKSLESCGIKGKSKIIHNVIDTDLFKPASAKEPHDKIRLLHVSNIKEMKNVQGIIQAVVELSKKRNDFSLTIVCEENYEVLNKSVTLGNHQNLIEVVPPVSQTEVAILMQNSDIYIHFSNYETFGLTLLEAVSCGVPVIATHTGLVEEFNIEKFGKLVIKNNIEDLKSKLNWMLDHYQSYNPEMMHNFVEENFSYNVIGKKYLDIYREIIHL
jgi:glycosyltransferase involved in cell wall biosynthesis